MVRVKTISASAAYVQVPSLPLPNHPHPMDRWTQRKNIVFYMLIESFGVFKLSKRCQALSTETTVLPNPAPQYPGCKI